MRKYDIYWPTRISQSCLVSWAFLNRKNTLFLDRSVTRVSKWILRSNITRKRQRLSSNQILLSMVSYQIWWITYYELCNENKKVTESFCCEEMIWNDTRPRLTLSIDNQTRKDFYWISLNCNYFKRFKKASDLLLVWYKTVVRYYDYCS